MIENGRYALQTMAADVQMAGYWGELSKIPAAPTALPDPCSLTITGAQNIQEGMTLHLQGYNDPSTLATPIALPTCLANHKAGTDVLVVRHADPTEVPKASAIAGQLYLQTGLTSSGQTFEYRLATGNDAAFTLLKKDGSAASLRPVLIHIYYISECSEPVSGSCTGADGGNPIPTLKRVELTVAASSSGGTCVPPTGVAGAPCMATVSIAEGIENMQIDYGSDTDNDGNPDGDYGNGDYVNAVALVTSPSNVMGVADWGNVMSVKINLVARSPERTPGYSDAKTYNLGTFGNTTATGDGYLRHTFVQAVRAVNPSGRRPS
jgi:type IV pilus assembly protein PilW